MTHRFTIDLSSKDDRQIERIQSLIAVTTKAEVIRKALSLLHWVVIEQERSSRIVVENKEENTSRELITL